ncbi:ATP-binding protein [Vagococcus sp. JNUCC 83]
MSNINKVNLTIDSRIISHLGEALIDDEKVALLELVKNSSDADALNCTIVIDTFFESSLGKGKIVIEDNGNGMNPYIIENAFLKIATSFKNKYQKVSPKFNRLAQGNKGIGRLALNQLGQHIHVKTKFDLDIVSDKLKSEEMNSMYGVDTLEELVLQEADTYNSFKIDWKLYEKKNERIEDIPIEIEKKEFNNTVFTHRKKHGTKIEVYGLKGLDFWRNVETANQLESEVLAFLNPYEDENVNFKVSIKLDNQIFRSDTYDKEYIKQSCDSFFTFHFNEEKKKLTLNTIRSKGYVQRQINTLIKSLESRNLELVNSNINYEEYYKKYLKETLVIDLSNVSSIYRDSPKSNLKDAYLYTSSEEHSDEETDVSNEAENDENTQFMYLPGDFFGEIYAYDFSPQVITSELKKMIENIVGVKLYRNNFRLFPYGNVGNDWLGMGHFNSRTKSVIYKQHTTTGFVNVNGENNLELLKELTNRQGLVLDKYGKNFLLIMKELIYKNAAYQDTDFTNNFSFIRKEVSEIKEGESITIADLTFIRKKNVVEDFEETVDSTVDIINNLIKIDKKENLENTENENENEDKLKMVFSELSKKSKDVKKEFVKKDKQIKEDYAYFNELLPVVGATIISETLAHEIIRLSNNVNSYSLKIRKAIPKNDQKTMIRNLGSIDSDIKFLARYASLLDVNSYSKRRRFEKLSVKESIKEIVHDSPLLIYRKLELKYLISGSDFSTKLIKDSFKIIIENFIINSTYWLERMNTKSPMIVFELHNTEKQLVIYDNGIGIAENVVEKLFDPFITNKPDGEGRGMGLNIVREMLREIGADIILSLEVNEYDNPYKFIITFPEEKDE